MTRLKSRQLSIPGGYGFLQPQFNWDSKKMVGQQPSFDRLVNAVIQVRLGNPHITAQHNLPTDYDNVANEVEAFQVRMCQAMGWNSYLSDDGGGIAYVPKSLTPLQNSPSAISAVAEKAKRIWSGVKTIDEWLDSGQPGVPADQAFNRAKVCAECAKNQPGGFETWFTKPASVAIAAQLEKASSQKLTVGSLDAALNVCNVCLCPLKLAVHVPLQIKLNHLSVDVERELRKVTPQCWVIAEKDGK